MSTKRISVLSISIVVLVILHLLPLWTGTRVNTTLVFGWWPFENFYATLRIFIIGTLWVWLLTGFLMPRNASDAIRRPDEEETSKGGA